MKTRNLDARAAMVQLITDRWNSTGGELDSEIDHRYKFAHSPDFRMSGWVGHDLLGFDAGDSNLYRYVRNDPTGMRDPFGLVKLSYDVIDKLAPGVDGGIKGYTSKWKLDEGAPCGGYIIQKVDFHWVVNDGNVSPNAYFVALFKNKEFDTRWYPYLEAWHVTKGKTDTDLFIKHQADRKWDDKVNSPGFSFEDRPKTEGLLVIRLNARYYDDFKLPDDFKVLNKNPTGELPGKLSIGAGGKLPDGGSNEIRRVFQAQWDVIKNGFGKETKVKDLSDKPPF